MDEKGSVVANVVEQVGEVISPVVGVRKWTFKKVMLSIITLYFLILIIKYLGIFVWKVLGLLRKYIHDITDENKMGEVFLWTFFGVVFGVLLHKQIIYGIDWVVKTWNEVAIPWFNGLF